MKSLLRLAVALALGLVIMSLLPLPLHAQANCRFPEITISIDHGVPGDTITISGRQFLPGEYVDVFFGNLLLSHEITMTNNAGGFGLEGIPIPDVPAGTYTIRAEVGNEAEEASFSVRPGVSVSPRSGAIGTTITVTGRGFGANETNIEVRRGLYETIKGGIAADAAGSWEARLEIPSWTRGEHEIRAWGHHTTNILRVRPTVFEVRPGIALGETSGAVGQSVAVSGTGFGANERNIRIVVDGRPVPTVPSSITADGSGRWNAAFTVPGLPAGEYAVTARGDTTPQRHVDEIAFEVRPVLTLSPDEGHVGMELTATGLGFPFGKRILILYGDEKVAESIVDHEGTFEAVFEVPESRSGPHEVVAAIRKDPNSVSDLEPVATAVFIMESNHPAVPLPESPADGGRVGFFRRGTPTFEWEEVFDLSGVYYSIKVATSPDFEPESVVLSATRLTETSYTPEEPLSNGTYYWTVQAVDGARNESGWTDPQRLRVGRIPMWGFIVIFSFVGLLLGLRTYFVLVRPRLYE